MSLFLAPQLPWGTRGKIRQAWWAGFVPGKGFFLETGNQKTTAYNFFRKATGNRQPAAGRLKIYRPAPPGWHGRGLPGHYEIDNPALKR